MHSLDASSSNNALRALRDASAWPAPASQLLYNAALKFNATFSVLVFALYVGKRFAPLITRALREVLHCSLDWASIGHFMDAPGSKKR
jgi:hypothetical protein